MKAIFTPSDARQLSREGVKNDWKDGKADEAVDWSHTSRWPCYDPIFISPRFNAPPGFTLPTGSRPDYWRNERLYRGGDIERHPGPKRALPSRGRSGLIQDMLPATAQHSDMAALELENYLRVKDIHGAEEFVIYNLNIIQNAGLCAIKLSITLWPLRVQT